MNKRVLFGIIIGGGLIVLSIVGVVSYFLFRKPSTQNQNDSITHQNNIITEKVTYKIDNVVFVLDLNKITKTASVDTTMLIADSDEYSEFGGSKVSMVPFMVNLSCSLYSSVFMDANKLEQLKAAGDLDQKPEAKELLKTIEGYTFSDFRMKFTDRETNEKIAECSGKTNKKEDIKFTAYRQYDPKTSFSGSEIGKLDNTK